MSTTVQVENLGFRQWYLQVSNPHPRIYSWLYATFVPASKLLEDAKEVNMSSPDSSSDIENGSFTVVDDRERAHSSLLCSRCGQTSGKPDRFHYRFFERMKALVRAKKILNKRVGIVLVVLLVLVVLGVGIWYALLLALVQRFKPPHPPHNGIEKIRSQWVEPGSTSQSPPAWLEDFSRDITPIACHSHNDYWRNIPLYDALYAGCTGVEADVWLSDTELYVGHNRRSLRKSRTFKSLYVDPLTTILQNQNAPTTFSNNKTPRGVFDNNFNTTLVLLVDFKSNGTELFPVVYDQLSSLRDNGWLTYFNGSAVIRGPITVVGTGNTPFDLVVSNSTYRDILFDAPLNELDSDSKYNLTNSHYASVSFSKALGHMWFNKLSSKQIKTVQKLIAVAESKGLISRYWDTPAWPVSFRTSIWKTLQENGVGMLNVDDLVAASRWNWKQCSIMGLELC